MTASTASYVFDGDEAYSTMIFSMRRRAADSNDIRCVGFILTMRAVAICQTNAKSRRNVNTVYFFSRYGP